MVAPVPDSVPANMGNGAVIGRVRWRSMTDRRLMYTLAEDAPGVCPVCKFPWVTDPGNYCHCTAPQSDDDKQMAAAYRQSALCRNAKLRADALDARRRIRAAIDRCEQGQGWEATVVPIGQARSRGRTAITR